MACNWLMMTSSGDNNGRVGVWVCSPTKLKIPKAEQETAQPTAARFNKQAKGKYSLTVDNFSFSSLQLVLSYILYLCK